MPNHARVFPRKCKRPSSQHNSRNLDNIGYRSCRQDKRQTNHQLLPSILHPKSIEELYGMGVFIHQNTVIRVIALKSRKIVKDVLMVWKLVILSIVPTLFIFWNSPTLPPYFLMSSIITLLPWTLGKRFGCYCNNTTSRTQLVICRIQPVNRLETISEFFGGNSSTIQGNESWIIQVCVELKTVSLPTEIDQSSAETLFRNFRGTDYQIMRSQPFQ